jgi:hypothetical protein
MREFTMSEEAIERAFQMVSTLYFVVTQAQLANIEIKKLQDELAMYKQQIYPVKENNN